ncbi:hypothetical protein C8F01DRAFT_1099264 [Mycena amicta]|nr:hypothetical protein C8F01DRAFT_1099264 [Mycena amicta]
MLRLSGRLPRRSFRMPASRKNSTEVPPKGYAIDASAGPMLRFQASLPRLPVPALESTAQKYLDSAKPHLTATEFSQTEAAVHAFLGSPLAAELQKRLQARASEPGRENWLSEWWNDVAYMGYRDPVVVFVSYFYVHVNDPLRTNQAQRAASLVKAMLPFRKMVESKELEPERVRGAPLCMASYKWLFHACRYPVKPSDTAHKFDPATHNHVVFVRKNKFYQVPLIHSSGQELSAAELETQIERVIELAGSDLAPPVGALTSDNRDNWTEARAELLAASPSNAASLEAIESAMIVVALDDTSPVTREEISSACWYRRWSESILRQAPAYRLRKRSVGLPRRALLHGRYSHSTHERVRSSDAREPAKRTSAHRQAKPSQHQPTLPLLSHHQLCLSLTPPLRVSTPSLPSTSCTCCSTLATERRLVSKTFKASPDAWAQLVKQLAFGRMFGRPGITYESAQTRKYQLGRTEVIRSASNESKAWVDAMLNVNETDETRAALMREAIRRHGEYSAWAADGQGVDRHLFGLKRMLRPDEPVPEIYQDKAYAHSSHWELSTSQLSSPFFDGWGYGEVVPDGYGLSYAIGDRYIRWTITSKRGDAARLRYYLEEAATEARDVMERAMAKEEATNKTKL